ncbi:MAG: PQQ-binding-like beta-propeller repeat protein [Alphaproteobacteria bacterium]|nr:PQQ-binding-like beta-propeller repeat protein [Alphaproteobacteria bacterium]MCD8520513.1 PQQ-binding-like beta-propeller repeat protein [Alphaproteobacteria bacterium]MCD8570644.1 PQQ-binding-like beta-propeller repeat protein [Alphaproteobacteria bacterium]
MKKRAIATFALLGIATLALSSCSAVEGVFLPKSKKKLPGERISVLELQKDLEPDGPDMMDEALILPAPWKNEFWPQAGGYPNHSMQHLSLEEGPLELQWKADIGMGSNDEIPLTSAPVVVDGRVFVVDGFSIMSAYDIKNGERLWRTSIKDPDEDDIVIGGGLSFGGGKLYATNGYDEVLALNPNSGEILWRKPIPTPSRAAPTIMDGRLYVSTYDNRLLALNPETGDIIWKHEGIAESAGLVGAASPAANRDIVVPAFTSGEIVALRVENGSIAWSDNLSGIRNTTGGLSALSDIRALPVLDKGLVIAISFSGRLVAIDERTGGRVWQREISGTNMPWVAGGYVFVLSENNELIALSRDNGAIKWVTSLGSYRDPESRSGAIRWTGPVLASNRLIAVSTDGRLAELNPETGELISETKLHRPVTIQPVVAGNTLYLLGTDGTLMAYR